MSGRAEHTVGELGEAGALARITNALSSADAAVVGPGDDSAVLRHTGDVVVTTDTMIEGPDFRLAWHDGFSLGWKLAATNLSDVAAMGAKPTALTVALACPNETDARLLEHISAGLDAACRLLAPGCGVVGGDLASAPVLTAAITALGDMNAHAPVLRSGARPGDLVAYAGELGLAGLGLSLLFRDGADADGTAHSRSIDDLWARHPVEIGAQLAPAPPIPLGEAAAAAGATSMIDVSDGLGLDATRIATSSGVTLQIDSAPMLSEFGEQLGVRVPLTAMLTGGEDHGLLATFPADAALPRGFRTIGRVLPAERVGPLMLDGAALEARGWDPYVGAAAGGGADERLHQPRPE